MAYGVVATVRGSIAFPCRIGLMMRQRRRASIAAISLSSHSRIAMRLRVAMVPVFQRLNVTRSGSPWLRVAHRGRGWATPQASATLLLNGLLDDCDIAHRHDLGRGQAHVEFVLDRDDQVHRRHAVRIAACCQEVTSVIMSGGRPRTSEKTLATRILVTPQQLEEGVRGPHPGDVRRDRRRLGQSELPFPQVKPWSGGKDLQIAFFAVGMRADELDRALRPRVIGEAADQRRLAPRPSTRQLIISGRSSSAAGRRRC